MPSFLDMLSRHFDEMHVVDAGRTRRHARKTGEATIDVLRHFGLRVEPLLQHVFDRIDAAARAVAFVPEHDVCRTGGGTKTAMNAAAKNALGFLHIRIVKLLAREVGLHCARLPGFGV